MNVVGKSVKSADFKFIRCYTFRLPGDFNALFLVFTIGWPSGDE